MKCGRAKPLVDLVADLKGLKSYRRELADVFVGQTHINDTMKDLAKYFDSLPFPKDAWNDDEQDGGFRVKGGRRAIWTPRGRRAWQYVDRYFELAKIRPEVT